MSYILDAIKKADEKRKAGAVPDLDTLHEVPIVDPRRPLWVYGLAAILLVNAGLIGWWLWSPRRAKAPEPAVASQAAAPRKPAAPGGTSATPAAPGPTVTIAPGKTKPQAPAPPTMPAATLTASGPGGKLPPAPGVRPDLPPPRQAAASLPAAPGKSAPPAPATPAEAAKVVPMVTGGPPVAAPPPTTSAPAPAPAPAPATATAPPHEEPLATPVASEPAPPEEDGTEELQAPVVAPKPHHKAKPRSTDPDENDPELAKIPLLKQLPPDFQQALPELHLSFLSYSIHPESRLVSISGKVLREGQDFGENLKLETITPHGVVMSSKGHRFRLNME